MLDSSHGSAYAPLVPVRTRRVQLISTAPVDLCRPAAGPGQQSRTRPRQPGTRGCSPARPRRGTLRTTSTADVLRIRRGRRACNQPAPPPSEFVNLELEDDAYAGVPCWSGGPTIWAHVTVAAAYDLRYSDIRSRMCNGGIAKKTLVTVAAALARTADFSTGRNARPTNEQLTKATGFTERTVQRARECLQLLGVATEILRGRQRTYVERMASWRMGDRHRGWASVWALHDDPQVNAAIHNVSPHPERSPSTTSTPLKKNPVTTRGRAARDRQGAASRRRSIDSQGLRLAGAWRAQPGAPRWAYRHSAASWANMLAKPAAAGWTPQDLNQLIRDWLAGHTIPNTPPRPIALLGTLLAWHTAHNTLHDRPAAADEARQAADLADAEQRKASQQAEHAAHQDARQQAQAAIGGHGHQWARREAQRLAQQAASRRTTHARTEHNVLTEAVTRVCGPHGI